MSNKVKFIVSEFLLNLTDPAPGFDALFEKEGAN